MKNPNVVELIEPVGKNTQFSVSDEQKATRFIQMMCYNGQQGETMTETKIRLYKKMNTKTSQ